jgi:hypothetical protein
MRRVMDRSAYARWLTAFLPGIPQRKGIHWLPPAVTGEYYEGGHWLGTFAVYLTTRAGLH